MCIFCDIIEGKIPSATIYEDDKVKAFLDISQVTKGHTLVVPKKHFDNFLECETGAKGMNILTNVHEVAGQSVMHCHIHLIPRYSEQDALKLEFQESEKQDLDALCAQLQYK